MAKVEPEALRFGAFPRRPHWWGSGQHLSPFFRLFLERVRLIAAGGAAARPYLAAVSAALPIFRERARDQAPRDRAMRQDHAQNVACALLACAASADWAPGKPFGFVAQPIADVGERTRWERPGWEYLFEVAFGPAKQGEISQRRIERAARELAACGWLKGRSVRVFDSAQGEWKAKASIKLLSLDAIKALGLFSALKAHWRWRQDQAKRKTEAVHAQRIAAGVATVARPDANRSAPAARPAPPAPPVPPHAGAPPTAPPAAPWTGPTETGLALADDLAKKLRLR